ncbi:MAG: hypothetical protein Q8R28_00605 [Dehalococcoidia bacterium]|nr:hypothetical protein [Dehalococcoidia bacterium]
MKGTEMTGDHSDFGCSYLSPEGDRCTFQAGEIDTIAKGEQPQSQPCIPEECLLLGELLLAGDLFSG